MPVAVFLIDLRRFLYRSDMSFRFPNTSGLVLLVKSEITHCVTIRDVFYDFFQDLVVIGILPVFHQRTDEIAENTAEVFMTGKPPFLFGTAEKAVIAVTAESTAHEKNLPNRFIIKPPFKC